MELESPRGGDMVRSQDSWADAGTGKTHGKYHRKHHLDQNFPQAHLYLFQFDIVASSRRVLNLTKRATRPGDSITAIKNRGHNGDTTGSKEDLFHLS